MKKSKLRKRKYKFGISIFMIILLFCIELPCNTYASEIEGGMAVSENDIAPITETTAMEMSSETGLGVEMESESRTINFNQKISELRSKFPHGKYWNHYVSRAGEDGDSLWNRNDTSFQDSVTDHPCATHSSGASASVGQYDCNFYGGIQCCGFAKRVYKYVYGVDFSSGPEPTSNWWEVAVGDLIVIENGNHWAFVIERNGNKAKIVEANRAGNCRINWDREIDLANCGFKDARHKPSDVVLVTDTTAPVISNLKVSNITKDGYTVTGKVSDNVGVAQVKCGTWGPNHTDSNAIWETATISNGTFTYRVSFSKVKCNSGGGVKRGMYITDVYAHDTSGNSSSYNANIMRASVKVTDTLFDTTKPDITFLRSNDVTNSQFSVRAIATDNLKVEKIEFTCYAPGKNTGVKKTVTATGGSATATFKLNEFNTGEGNYRIDAYAYDSAGNKSSVVRTLYVYINCTAPTIENVKTVKTASGSYTLQADIGDPNGIVKVEWITWKPGEKSDSSKGYVLTDTVTNQTSIALTKTIDVTRISGNNPIAYGNYVTKIVAYDTYNNKREYSITVPLQNPINTDKDNTGNVDNKDKDNGGNSNSTVNNNNSNNNDNENGNNPNPSTSQGKTGTEGFVYRLYNIAMGREADETGFNDWNSQLKNKEKTAAEVAQGFIFSEEFKNFNYNNVQYVKILYRTMFGREADEGGLNGWVADLENGMSREYVYRGFVESAEFSNLCERYSVERGSVPLDTYRDRNAGATGFIARLYTKMLGREYDGNGLEYWCGKYHTGENTIEEIATVGFLHSQELQNLQLSDEEFVRRMYQTFLNREPEENGLQDWIGRLRRGEETRDSLVYGFTNSREFVNLKREYNLP